MLKTDRIHHTSYLLSTEIDLSELKDNKAEIFDLKQDYEILSLSLEVLDDNLTGTIDVGLGKEKEYFLNDIDLSKKEVFKSKVEATIKHDSSVVIETTARQGKLRLRIFYFTPSTMYR